MEQKRSGNAIGNGTGPGSEREEKKDRNRNGNRGSPSQLGGAGGGAQYQAEISPVPVLPGRASCAPAPGTGTGTGPGLGPNTGGQSRVALLRGARCRRAHCRRRRRRRGAGGAGPVPGPRSPERAGWGHIPPRCRDSRRRGDRSLPPSRGARRAVPTERPGRRRRLRSLRGGGRAGMRCSVVLSPTNIALVPASRRRGLRQWDRPGTDATPRPPGGRRGTEPRAREGTGRTHGSLGPAGTPRDRARRLENTQNFMARRGARTGAPGAGVAGAPALRGPGTGSAKSAGGRERGPAGRSSGAR